MANAKTHTQASKQQASLAQRDVQITLPRVRMQEAAKREHDNEQQHA